jgi:glycosyltransferase involved in cell wall biosynthesis
MRKTLDYICMQPTRQGQASYAHVNEIVAGLRRRGWQVRLVEPQHPQPGRADGFRRAVAAASTQLAYWLRCGFRPAAFVYVRAHFLALPTVLLASARGSIVVQEINGPASDIYDAWPRLRPLAGLLTAIMHVQFRLADAIVVVTPGLEGYLHDRTGRRRGYHVIGNGADVDRFHPLGPASGGTSREYVVFVGALASWQGIDTVLSAVEASEWPSAVDLVIAGDGIERDKVGVAAKANSRIQWLGTIPYADSPGLVARSLASLVPMSDAPRSRYGLSPLKLFEAMACGVPVIASDLPGLGDVVRSHACGITFPAGDAGALARAVSMLARDPTSALAMGSSGRAAAVAFYSWEARAGQTEQALGEIATRRSSRSDQSMRAVGRRFRRRPSSDGRPASPRCP